MKVDMIFLKHMLERCEKVRKITASTTKEEFCYDPDKQDLVVHSLEIIGEATTHLSQEFKEKYADIPWVEIKDLRNVLTHQYFRIDPEEVWEISQTDVEELYSFLVNICGT